MLDTPADAQPDLRPGLMLCAYEPELGWGTDGADADANWTPPGARLIPVQAEAPEALARTLMDRLRDPACRAALLVGRATGADDFLIQTRAENRVLNGKGRLVPTGPGVARATAPALEMAQTLSEAGLSARLSSETVTDPGNYLLYRVLCSLPDGPEAPLVGLLRVPEGEGSAITRAVRLAAEAMARHLSPLPRPRAA
jgi:pyrrolidone-carboxylate peptidase